MRIQAYGQAGDRNPAPEIDPQCPTSRRRPQPMRSRDIVSATAGSRNSILGLSYNSPLRYQGHVVLDEERNRKSRREASPGRARHQGSPVGFGSSNIVSAASTAD